MKIEIVVGNIVKQADIEAVVNSANANLRMGSGVAGATGGDTGSGLPGMAVTAYSGFGNDDDW